MAAGRGHTPRAALCRGRHMEGRKYGILKFGCFWRIGVCIADSDIFAPLTLPQFWDHIPNCQWSTTPHKAVCTPRNLHCWSDWSFTWCKTVQDPCCPLLFYWQSQFNVLHYSHVSKFCVKFGNSAWNLVIWFLGKYVNLLQLDARF